MPRGGVHPGGRNISLDPRVPQPPATGAGATGLGNIGDILKQIAAGGGAAASEGVRKLTPKDIANMQANAAAQLGAGLTGPFTPEAEASGYASMVAQFYGVNHPAAQKWVSYAQARNWDAATFGRWLRTRPEFKSTDVGRRMTADILAVVSSIFRGT